MDGLLFFSLFTDFLGLFAISLGIIGRFCVLFLMNC